MVNKLVCASFLIILGSYVQIEVESSKILTIFPAVSRSHYIALEELLKELARRGHHITAMSYFPQKKPLDNWRDIELEYFNEFDEIIQSYVDHAGERLYVIKKMLFESHDEMMERWQDSIMKNPEVQNLLSNEQFDLVILEGMMGDQYLGFAAYFKCPVVAFSSLPPLPAINKIIGNPNSVSFIPVPMLEYKEPMNFIQRLSNYVFFGIGLLFTHIIQSKGSNLYEKHFPSPQYPTFNEMQKNISLVLVNYHFTQGNPRPMVPGLVEIGGVQVKENPESLPVDLKKWMDEAEHGVIYMSMGSNVKSANFPKPKLDAFIKTFAKLKQRIVWKFENTSLPGLPNNVLISKWLPQDDLLAHPNIKLFITHGGLGSILEAKVRAVPIIGIPIFADQMSNTNEVVADGWGLDLPFVELTAEKLTDRIVTILGNTTFKQNVEKLSNIFRDRPQSPLETGVFWIEYVIRHRGAKHMQCNAVHLNFFQLHSLDVIGFLMTIVLIVFYIKWKIVKCIWKRVFKRNLKNKND